MTTTQRACPNCNGTLPPEAQFCLHCGTATPTDPGVPPRTASTGVFEVDKVTRALAGRYRIERVVGEGGMATVYLAEDVKHQREVAVKVMRPELAATLGADRFLREVQIAARLSHPHILPMHDSGEAAGILYYVMPYVEGETLRERIIRQGALPPEEALRLAREIAEALAYAHGRGFIHRDIKPANILLQSGHALVADFGIARAVDEGGGESLTRTGLAVGTPQYMAPEQASGEKDVDGRADVYATGAILYELLTGEPPFTGANPRAILTKSLTEAPRPVTAVRPGLPPMFDTLLQKALARSPDDRYATAEAFVAAIDMVRQSTPTPSQATMAIPGPATLATGAAPSVSAKAGLAAWLTPRNGLVAALGAAALFFALRGRAPGATGAGDGGPRGNRLVVLPFRNQGGQNDLYLVEGISSDVRNRLNRLSGLQVIASGSSDEYRDSKKTMQDIARELGADYILSADARWTEGSAGRLVVTPQLRDARSGEVKWQQSLDLPAAELVAAPAEIATQVARKLDVQLAEADAASLAFRPTTNAEAYRSFLRGSFLTGSDPGTLRESIQELEQAVALDSEFALAWSRLSGRYATLYANVTKDPTVLTQAKEALTRAEALQPGADFVRFARYGYLSTVPGAQAEALAELDNLLRTFPNNAGLLSTSASADLDRGELGTALAKLERARDLDPRAGGTLSNLTAVYTALGRGADAVAVGEALVRVRPRDLTSAQALLMAHLSNGDLDGARAAIRASVERGIPALRLAAHFAAYQETAFALEEADQQVVLRLTPSAFDGDRSWWAQSLATLYWQRGDTVRARAYADSALAPTRQLIAATPDDSQQHGLLALMLAYLGRGAEARAELPLALQDLSSRTSRTYNRLSAAKAELALGNRDAAVEHLKLLRAQGHYVTNGWMRVDPTFASLKGYPPFEQMLQGK
jgi:serine/threonine-protein kinase